MYDIIEDIDEPGDFQSPTGVLLVTVGTEKATQFSHNPLGRITLRVSYRTVEGFDVQLIQGFFSTEGRKLGSAI